MALIFNGAASSGGHSALQLWVWGEVVLVLCAKEEEQLCTNKAIRAWEQLTSDYWAESHVNMTVEHTIRSLCNTSHAPLDTTVEHQAAFGNIFCSPQHISSLIISTLRLISDPLCECFKLSCKPERQPAGWWPATILRAAIMVHACVVQQWKPPDLVHIHLARKGQHSNLASKGHAIWRLLNENIRFFFLEPVLLSKAIR